MSKIPETAAQTLRLARGVGGVQGRLLAEAVDRSLNTPDLAQRTRTSTAIDQGLAALGGYDPDPVPIRVKKQMRTDGQLRFALAATKAPLLSAPFHFECRSAEVRELLTEVFLRSGFLPELLQMSLNAIDFGFQASEALWRAESQYKIAWDEPAADGGVTVQQRTFPQIFLPRRFKDLDPAKVTLLRDDHGDLVGLAHGNPGVPLGSMEDVRKAMAEGTINLLSAEKAFVFTPSLEFGDYRGEGRLDWAYDPWYWQKIVYLIALRWYERKADPPYVLYAPASTGLPGDGISDTAGYDANDPRQDTMVLGSRAIAKLKSSGHIVLPSEVFMDTEGRPSNTRGWELKEVQVQDMHPAFIDFLDHLDKKKTRAVLAPDIALSRDRQAGTLGSTEAIVGVTVEMQNQTLRSFLRHFNSFVLEPFLRYNNIKDRARLSTTGVLRDNMESLRAFTMKVMEADMLAEQAWGRVFPQSLTQMVDREGLVRELGLPHRPIDPNAPMPKPPAPTPTAEASVGRDNISNPQARPGKTNTGGGRAKAALDPELATDPGLRLDFASDDLVRAVSREAASFEDWVGATAADAPARRTLSVYEKAAAALLLWYLLRGDKEDAGGNRVAGDKSLDALVWDGRKPRAPAALVSAFDELHAKAAGLEGRGLTLHPDAPTRLLPRVRAALDQTLGGLRTDVAGAGGINAWVAQALQQGANASLGIMDRFGPSSAALAALAETEAERIILANVEGILLNIENIARRNTQNLMERVLMSGRRKLDMVADAASFRFNTLYSDLTLEAHLRAAYRAGLVATALKNDVVFFVKIPGGGPVDIDEPASVGSKYNYIAASDEYWQAVGEQSNAPNPHMSFGLHHGSKSYWYPVPPTSRVRSPSGMDRGLASRSLTTTQPVAISSDGAQVINLTLPPMNVNVAPSPVAVRNDVRPAPVTIGAPPEVTVNVPPATKPGPVRVTFSRDAATGRIVGADVTPQA